MEKTRIIVTRAFEGERTPQDAFVRAILNSGSMDNGEKCLQDNGDGSIMGNVEPLCSSPAFPEEGGANG